MLKPTLCFLIDLATGNMDNAVISSNKDPHQDSLHEDAEPPQQEPLKVKDAGPRPGQTEHAIYITGPEEHHDFQSYLRDTPPEQVIEAIAAVSLP